jgi:deoxyribonuclease V
MEKESYSAEELAKKYNIDMEALKREQIKLSKSLSLKDSMDFSLAERISAISTIFVGNQIISGIIVCNPEMEIIEQEYFQDKIRFPYIPGFRAYRELPAMIKAFEKLEEKPDLILINGHGITHPRLGMASHFSLSTGIPTIGIANSLIIGKEKNEDIILNDKKIGKVLVTKPGSKPLYISPGNLISLETAYKLVSKMIRLPHKLPEPMHLAHKYVDEIKDELLKI